MVTYSDWGRRQVASYNVHSGALTTHARDLTRPGGVIVAHPTDVQGEWRFVFSCRAAENGVKNPIPDKPHYPDRLQHRYLQGLDANKRPCLAPFLAA